MEVTWLWLGKNTGGSMWLGVSFEIKKKTLHNIQFAFSVSYFDK